METIFDYNPTGEELKRFGGREQFEWAQENGINIYAHPDNTFYHLGLLFSMRGDKKKANEYWAKIKNRAMLTTLVEDF